MAEDWVEVEEEGKERKSIVEAQDEFERSLARFRGARRGWGTSVRSSSRGLLAS